jgi:hypothetical protein
MYVLQVREIEGAEAAVQINVAVEERCDAAKVVRI